MNSRPYADVFEYFTPDHFKRSSLPTLPPEESAMEKQTPVPVSLKEYRAFLDELRDI